MDMLNIFKKKSLKFYLLSLLITLSLNFCSKSYATNLNLNNSSLNISLNNSSNISSFHSNFFKDNFYSYTVNDHIFDKNSFNDFYKTLETKNQDLFKIIDKNSLEEKKNFEQRFNLIAKNSVDVEFQLLECEDLTSDCLEVNSFVPLNENSKNRIELKSQYGIKRDCLKKGDLIIAVNDKKIDNMGRYEKEELIEELKYSQDLSIDFLRPTIDGKFESMSYVSLTDFSKENYNLIQQINLPDLSYDVLFLNESENALLYVKINESVNYDVAAHLKQLLLEYFKQNATIKVPIILFDLRNCSGGNFGAAKKIVGWFLPKNKQYITIKNLGNYDDITLKNQETQLVNNVAVSLIVNEQTKDAACQLASIFKNSCNATLFGEKTKGAFLELKYAKLNENFDSNSFDYVVFPKSAYSTNMSSFKFKKIENELKPDVNSLNLPAVILALLEIYKNFDKNSSEINCSKIVELIKKFENRSDLHNMFKSLSQINLNKKNIERNQFTNSLSKVNLYNFIKQTDEFSKINLNRNSKNDVEDYLIHNTELINNLDISEKLYLFSFILFKYFALNKFEELKKLCKSDEFYNIFDVSDRNLLAFVFKNLDPLNIVQYFRNKNWENGIDTTFLKFDQHISFFNLNDILKNASLNDSVETFKKTVTKNKSLDDYVAMASKQKMMDLWQKFCDKFEKNKN